MRRPVATSLAALGVGATLAIGFAVAALASAEPSSSPTAAATTSETSTSEAGKSVAYRAGLSGASEVPKPRGVRAGAGGALALTLTDNAGTYTARWKLTFHKLTGKAVAAHIHRGRPGKAGPVVVPLCGPCRSGQSGAAKLSHAVVTAIQTGAAYVNVHTKKNRAGEIRGQITR